MAETRRKIVLGLGNILNRDEGFGVQAVKALEAALGAFGSPSELELVDGGVLGLELLPLVEDCSYLLIIDAINASKPAGTVIELARDEIPLYSGVRLSQHQLTFQEVLGLASARDRLPEYLYLIGVQPEYMTMGLELSAIVSATLPVVVGRVTAVLQEWGLIHSGWIDHWGGPRMPVL